MKNPNAFIVSPRTQFWQRGFAAFILATALILALLSIPESETGVRVYNPSSTKPYIVKVGDKVLTQTRSMS